MTTAKTRAQMVLDLSQAHARRATSEYALAQLERAEHIARLRRLRLERDAGDNQSVGNAIGTLAANDDENTQS